jgi:hypothetical protein
LSLKTNIDGLSVVWLQNHWDDFSGFASKLEATILSDLVSKSVVTVSPNLTSKPVAVGFLVYTSKTGSYGLVI